MTESLAEQNGRIHGEPRKLEDGVFHVTDLLREPAALLYDRYTGVEDPEGVPPWLSVRGRKLEEAALDMMGLPETARDREIEYVVPLSEDEPLTDEIKRGHARIVGHPDYLADTPTGHGPTGIELGEIKSQLGTDDHARRDQALEQALTYAGLHNRQEGGRRVERVRVVMAGLYEIDDSETVPVRDVATDPIVEYLEAKARTLHRAIQDGDRGACEAFDAEHDPPTSRDDPVAVTPIADGDLGGACDELMAAAVLKSWAEDVYDEHRERYQATVEDWHEDAGEPGWEDYREDAKRKAPRLGGTIGIVTKTVEEVVAPDILEPKQETVEELRDEWETVKEEAIQEARTEHADLLESLREAEKDLDCAREQATVQRKEPNYVRAWKPNDVVPERAARLLLDDEGGEG